MVHHPQRPFEERLDRQAQTIQRLLIINQVSMAMQSTVELERLLHIVLSGITAGEGLGFNRAILFLVNSDRTFLEGRMGVGPINHEECRHIWNEIFSSELQLIDFLRFFGGVKAYQNSELNRRTRGLRIPLRPGAGIVAQSVLEKRAFVIENVENDPRVNPEIRDLLQTQVFAATPLIASDEALGVIVVDNRFTRRPIGADDLQMLALLANQAAVAVLNARHVARISRFNVELEEKVRQATEDLEKSNAALQERVAEMAALHRIALAINAHHQLEPQLDLVIDEAMSLLQADRGAVFLAKSGKTENGAPVRSLELLNRRGAIEADRRAAEFAKCEGILYQVIQDGEPITLTRLNPATMGPGEACTVLAVPLQLGKGVIGAMLLERVRPDAFSHNDLEMLAMFASQASQAILNARNYERLERQYEELQKAQSELVKKERLALLGEMAAIVAHEIRNPLTAVKGFSQRMKRKAPGNEDVARYSQIIVEEVDRLDNVIADVLDFARRAAPKWQEVDLAQVLRQTMDIVGAGLQKAEVVLSVEIGADLPRLKGDPAQLKQVFLNICQNALKAMPEGGAMGIIAACKSGTIQVFISDTGQGIPPEVRGRIFQPFFTTRTHGTGLGLSLAQHIVEDHGGRISFESEVGHGTTFLIELPAMIPAPQGENES